MPVTKFKALHGQHGLKVCSAYIQNEQKTGGLVSFIGCSNKEPIQDILEQQIQAGKNIESGRTGYHVIQSFSQDDPVTALDVHLAGVQLARSFYKNHKAIVCTHQDTFHPHNHLLISSLDGMTNRKLVDKRNGDQGLYALRQASDEIAQRMGCSVVKNPPSAAISRKPNFSKRLFEEEKPSFISKLENDIHSLMKESTDYDDFSERLFSKGWRKNKKADTIYYRHTSMQRSVSEEKMPLFLREPFLKRYFKRKEKKPIEKLIDPPPLPQTELAAQINLLYQESVTILKIYEEQRAMAGPFFKERRNEQINYAQQLSDHVRYCNETNLQTMEEVMSHWQNANTAVSRLAKEYANEKELAKNSSDPSQRARHITKANQLWLSLKQKTGQREHYRSILFCKEDRPKLPVIDVSRYSIKQEKKGLLVRVSESLSFFARESWLVQNTVKKMVIAPMTVIEAVKKGAKRITGSKLFELIGKQKASQEDSKQRSVLEDWNRTFEGIHSEFVRPAESIDEDLIEREEQREYESDQKEAEEEKQQETISQPSWFADIDEYEFE